MKKIPTLAEQMLSIGIKEGNVNSVILALIVGEFEKPKETINVPKVEKLLDILA